MDTELDGTGGSPEGSRERGRTSRRRLILAGAVGAVAGAIATGERPAAAQQGGGDQGALIMGSNDFYKNTAPTNVNSANVASVSTVLKASPNYLNYVVASGYFVFRADASTPGGNVGVNGLEGIGNGTGAGVMGYCGGGYGVIATGSTGTYSASTGGGVGVYGVSPSGVGVNGFSNTGYGGQFNGGRAPIRLASSSAVGAPTSGSHQVGELWVDNVGVLWFCKADGTPGTWVQVTESSSFRTLPTPERFVDTRTKLGGVQGPVPAGTTSTFQMTGRNGESANPALQIPPTATAIVGNLSVIGSAGAPVGSFVTMWPSGARPTTSSISFGPGSVVANAYTVGLGAGTAGQKIITVFAQQACDYIVDVVGYYA